MSFVDLLQLFSAVGVREEVSEKKIVIVYFICMEDMRISVHIVDFSWTLPLKELPTRYFELPANKGALLIFPFERKLASKQVSFLKAFYYIYLSIKIHLPLNINLDIYSYHF
jgi:hypothetical protein